MAQVSCVLHLDIKEGLSAGAGGKYRRMFPDLEGLRVQESDLLALGRAGAALDVAEDKPEGDNPRIAAGHTMFGHMIAHDITADRSLLAHHHRVREIRNFRTPALDFESLYGAGPTGAPYLYDTHDPDKFLIGGNSAGRRDDLPRNAQGIGLMGDVRNDVHGMISQLHLAMLKLHNQAVDQVRRDGAAKGDVFSQAQRNVRWHLQWIAINEYLPLTVGEDLMHELLERGPRYFKPAHEPFIPVEFADAAYRFGHAQIRVRYRLNAQTTAEIFPDLAGGRPVPPERVVDWRYFLPLDPAIAPQNSARIRPKMAHTLIDLPESIVGTGVVPEYHSLACRDLMRAHALNLPSGESLARHIGSKPLTADEAGLRAQGWTSETPLWYYILREAEVRNNGERLGDVGGRIVAETLLGIIDADPTSYRAADPEWRPVFPSTKAGGFTLADAVNMSRRVEAVT